MPVPAAVTTIADSYLALVDRMIPGRLEALYLYGSVALEDYRHGSSDIDFVAILPSLGDESTAAALREVHRRLSERFPRPYFDGIYLTWDDLACDPTGTTGMFAHENGFGIDGDFERCPVTWQTLAQCGVTVRGPEVATIKVATDPSRLADWTHDNLDEYWRKWWMDVSNPLSIKGLGGLGSAIPMWGVLGVSRLHYTLGTGRITSKTGAGGYARSIFAPRWHRIIDEALRIRHGSSKRSAYLNPVTRRTEALEYMDMAIEDAHRGDPLYRKRDTT